MSQFLSIIGEYLVNICPSERNPCALLVMLRVSSFLQSSPLSIENL